ncbi:MAG: hypothetical protein LBG88_02555 [Christensenellaceae bacterium]|jgi:hypothetical protein|nr:hypothetical protein [Christensenellaceae bacterium]
MEKHLFLGCMTYKGFTNYFNNIIDFYDLKKLYILKGGSGVGKSTFMRKFAVAFPDESVDFLHCSADPDSLDGVILTNKKIGIIDGTAPHIVDVKYPGVIDETVNLGEFIIEKNVNVTKETIDEINAQKKAHYEIIQNHLTLIRELHMELEGLYKDAIDFKKEDALLAKIIQKLKA